MSHLIADLIEPCVNRQFLVFVDNVRYVSDIQKLVQMNRPEKWDSKGFCNQLWNGEIYCGFAEVVPLIDWVNQNCGLLHNPKDEILELLAKYQELSDLTRLPELPWPHGAVYFSRLDFPK